VRDPRDGDGPLSAAGRDPTIRTPTAHRDASIEQLLTRLAALASGRPDPQLVLRWVQAMLDDDDIVDSAETAHTFRCDEWYVCWCCEVGVRRGDLQHSAPRMRPPGARLPLESWRRSRLDPLARLALEAGFDEQRDRHASG
jgi:hypothetical protein